MPFLHKMCSLESESIKAGQLPAMEAKAVLHSSVMPWTRMSSTSRLLARSSEERMMPAITASDSGGCDRLSVFPSLLWRCTIAKLLCVDDCRSIELLEEGISPRILREVLNFPDAAADVTPEALVLP